MRQCSLMFRTVSNQHLLTLACKIFGCVYPFRHPPSPSKQIMNTYEGIESLSPSRSCAVKSIYAALEILKEEGGELRSREIVNRIPERIEFTDWENHIYGKTGYIRWQSMLHFFSIDLVKAGYLRKLKGVWYLTEEGEEAMSLGPVALLKSATDKYKEWNKKRETKDSEVDEEDIDDEKEQKATIEQLEESAIYGIRNHIRSKNPYEFQDLVAALLCAMGYFIPFVSPKGKDGGIDIIAFQDPLGANTPRIKVQVKHRMDASIAVDDIRSLTGLLNKDGDIGLFVTSGRFTSESERFSRDGHIHVKLIDGDTFIGMWKEFYPKLSDAEKILLPLHPIYFLGTNE